MPAQVGYFDTLKSAASKVFTYLASITLTGTDGKTITVTQNTSLDEAVAMSSKAPKASPVFTGNVRGTTAATDFAAINPINAGVSHVGSLSWISIADNQTMTITMDVRIGMLFVVSSATNNSAGVFFAEYTSATITKLADPSSYFEVIDTDTTKIAIFKSAGSAVINIKNYMNATRNIGVFSLGFIASATAPA